MHRVRGSCICALIDVIILVLNNRLRDEPTDRSREGRGRAQEHLKRMQKYTDLSLGLNICVL